MKCFKVKKLISEYIDRDLEKKERIFLERHLDSCPDCQKLLKDFQRITEDAKELEALSPSEKTWLNIKEKLKNEEQKVMTFKSQKRSWFTVLLYPPKLKYTVGSVLTAVFVIVAVIFGWQYWKERSIFGEGDLQKYTLAKLEEAQRHYQLAIKALWEAVSAQGNQLDPKIAEVFRKNLEILDSSIVTCKQLVLQNPEDIEARNYLLAAYREKVDFLNDIMKVKRISSIKRESKITL